MAKAKKEDKKSLLKGIAKQGGGDTPGHGGQYVELGGFKKDFFKGGKYEVPPARKGNRPAIYNTMVKDQITKGFATPKDHAKQLAPLGYKGFRYFNTKTGRTQNYDISSSVHRGKTTTDANVQSI